MIKRRTAVLILIVFPLSLFSCGRRTPETEEMTETTPETTKETKSNRVEAGDFLAAVVDPKSGL